MARKRTTTAPTRESDGTLSEHLETLRHIRDLAIKGGNYSAAANAEIARGKAMGYYVNRRQVEATVTTAEPVRVVFEYPDNGRLEA